MRRLALVLLAALVLAPAALAKEATVTMAGGGPPGGIDAGTPWSADVKVMVDQQIVPSDFPAPMIQLLNLDTGRTVEVATAATGKPGIYHADVVFPQKGTWAYSVLDRAGYRTFDLGQVNVDAKGTPSGGFDFPTLPVLGGVLLALLGLSGAALIARSRRAQPATQ